MLSEIKMKLWAALYAMIWIVLIEFLLAMTPGSSPVLIYLHFVLGVAIVGLAFYNFSMLRKTRVPGRMKRISQASFNISVLVAIFGALLFFEVVPPMPCRRKMPGEQRLFIKRCIFIT